MIRREGYFRSSVSALEGQGNAGTIGERESGEGGREGEKEEGREKG